MDNLGRLQSALAVFEDLDENHAGLTTHQMKNFREYVELLKDQETMSNFTGQDKGRKQARILMADIFLNLKAPIFTVCAITLPLNKIQSASQEKYNDIAKWSRTAKVPTTFAKVAWDTCASYDVEPLADKIRLRGIEVLSKKRKITS